MHIVYSRRLTLNVILLAKHCLRFVLLGFVYYCCCCCFSLWLKRQKRIWISDLNVNKTKQNMCVNIVRKRFRLQVMSLVIWQPVLFTIHICTTDNLSKSSPNPQNARKIQWIFRTEVQHAWGSAVDDWLIRRRNYDCVVFGNGGERESL